MDNVSYPTKVPIKYSFSNIVSSLGITQIFHVSLIDIFDSQIMRLETSLHYSEDSGESGGE